MAPDLLQTTRALVSLEETILKALDNAAARDLRDTLSADALGELKAAMDRLRPLLWVYINKRNRERPRPSDFDEFISDIATSADAALGPQLVFAAPVPSSPEPSAILGWWYRRL